jgi:predicted Zn-dependent peptidase
MKKRILFIMAFVIATAMTTAQIDRSQIPASGPTPEINLGEPYTFKLKNGLQVLVVTDKKLPTVNFSLNLNTPPIYEGNKAGVQSLTGAIMGKGTKTMPKETFNEEVDFLGAFVSISTSGGYMSTLSKYKEQVFKMFVDAALNPNFTQVELDFEKEQLIAGIKSGENSAAAIAGKVRNALMYGINHPAGEFATEETINSVTIADVEQFYRTYFVPSKGYLVISGDIEGKEAKKLVNKYLKSWNAGMAPEVTYPEVKDVPYTQVNFIDVPNAVQTELAIMNVSDLKMNHPDYYAATVANSILGGSFGSYLNMNLREANGYTYGAGSRIGANRYYNSSFAASTKVRNEVTDSAVVEVMKEMERIRNTFVDETMLANAKAQFLGDFIMSSEDKEVVADRAITIKTNNLPEDFYKNFIANINAVTKEDVKRVANKYVKTENARIILVGKATDVLENLEKMELNGKPVPIKFFDKDANPTERPSGVEVPTGATAQTVLDSYIAAIGGKDAVAKIKSTSYRATLDSPMGEVALIEKRDSKNRMSLDVTFGGNSMQKQVIANGKGRTVAQGQTMEAAGDELIALQTEAVFIPELNMATNAKLAGAEMKDGKKVYVIQWSDSKKSFYDMETGLLLSSETTIKAQGQEIVQALNYSNYKEVKGVKFPMTLSQNMMGQDVSFEVKEFKVNEGVTDADFK